MLLDSITKFAILQAAKEIDSEGVPKDHQWAEYWIVVDDHEYQFKYLIRKAYLLSTGKAIDENKFTSSPYTRTYITKKFGFPTYFKVPDNVDFFNQKDLDFFATHAGKAYRKENKRDVAAGNVIKSTIFRKTNAWISLLNLHDYGVEMDERWQVSGYFKPYSWARLFKPEYRKYKVFFTLGVNSKHRALVMKID